jgi:putative SOS response-associated peptidase YedK
MCGRFIQHSDPEIYAERFELEPDPAMAPGAPGRPRPRWNLAPTQTALAIRQGADGRRRLAPLRWGLVPFWSKGPDPKLSMFNARCETVAEKPAYRAAFRERRCLIPAEGFYEWRAEGRHKQPYLIRRRDGAPFAMAGLWEHWRAEEEPGQGQGPREIESCTILIVESNAAIRPLHERMPVVLAPEAWAAWLDPQNRDTRSLLPLLVPTPDAEWQLVPVSRRVNDARSDDADLIEPLTGLALPPSESRPRPEGR